jgi:hypothetical protein
MFEDKSGAWVLNATYSDPVTLYRYDDWVKDHPIHEVIDLPGVVLNDDALGWFRRLQGKKYDWFPIAWGMLKLPMWILSSIKTWREDPDKWSCTELAIRPWAAQGVLCTVAPDEWYALHPDNIYQAMLERRAGYAAALKEADRRR